MTYEIDSTEIKFCGKDMEEAYQQGRIDAIDEFVNFAKTHNFEINKRYYNETIQGFVEYIAKQVKEQKNDSKNRR